MRVRSWIILLATAGCRPDEALPPMVTAIDATAPQRAEVAPALGYGQVDVPVRLLNRYSAAVPGGDATVTVSGATATAGEPVVAFDPAGYGEVEVVAQAPERFEVAVAATADADIELADPAACWSLAGPAQTFGLRRTAVLEGDLAGATQVVALLGGLALAFDREVWFTGGAADSIPHRVLVLEDPVLELEAVQVDGDGVLDVLARSTDEVVLLRGRARGGLGWGAGFAAEGRGLVGASVDDLDGDGINDLGLALVGSADSTFVALLGDGSFGFEEDQALRLELAFVPDDLELSQSESDGLAEIAFIATDSKLMRYTRTSGAWAETNPSSLDTNLAGPASFLGAADLDQGGADDPILLSHAEAGVERSVLFYTLEGGTTQYQKSYFAPAFALGDLSGDGAADVVALEGSDVHLVHFEASDGGSDLSYLTVGEVRVDRGDGAEPEAGPIAVGRLDGDAVPDLALLDQGINLFFGRDSENAWAPSDAAWTRYDLALGQAPVLADLDADPGSDTMAAWVDLYGVPVLRTWWVQPDDKGGPPELVRRGELTFDDGDLPLGLALQGGRVYGLIERAGVRWLVQLLRDGGDTYVTGGAVEVGGACLLAGAFADGAVVAVVDEAGGAAFLSEDLAEVSAEALGAWGCLAAGDTDGDGVDGLLIGASEGCSLLAIDLDGDGIDEVAEHDGASLTVTWAGASWSLVGGPLLSAADLDGDGLPALLAASGAQIWVHTPVGGGFAPAAALHGGVPGVASPVVGDLTGDGLLDLAVIGADGMLGLAPGTP